MSGEFSIEFIPTCLRVKIAEKTGIAYEAVECVLNELQNQHMIQLQQIRRAEAKERALGKLTAEERQALGFE